MDKSDNKKLKERLFNIWQSADFSPFFEKYAKLAHLVKKGTVIFNEGDPLDKLYFVKKGFVKLYRLSDEGRESTIYLYGPNSVLGVRALTLEDKTARHYAEAITDLELTSIEHEKYFDILSSNPEYVIDLLHIFIDRLNYTERKLEGFILEDSVARVAYFLSDSVKRFGIQKGGKYELPLELTHQRIAEFVGSFRETVTNAIQKLEKEGVVSINRGKVTILDIVKLHKYAGL